MLQKLSIGLLCAALAGCGGGGGTAQPAPPPAPIVTLTAPVTQVLAGGKAVTVSAAVSDGASVSWELAAGALGSITASGSSAQYVPPASVAANTRVVLTAKAGGTSQSITLHLYPEPGPAGLYHIAGTLGERALLDGTGGAARFSEISDAARAQDGGLLVADQFDLYKEFNALRKIGSDRTVSTLLRTAPGHADGDASQARLGSIFSVAQTEDGTIWFLDRFEGKSYLRRLANNRVSTLFDNGSLGIGRLYAAPGNMLYMTTASGTAILKMAASADTPTLLAGADVVQGGPQLDGAGAAARFDRIADLTIMPSGELVAADACTLRKITADGTVSTIAGAPLAGCALVDGPVASARFGGITSVAVAPAGDILVLEWVSGTEPRFFVRALSAAGTVATIAALPASMRDGNLIQSYPLRVRLSGAGDVLLVREGEIGRLSDGQLLPYAGLEDDSGAEIDGVGAAARFMTPIQLSADLAGNVYVIDDWAGFNGTITVHAGIRLRKIAPDGKVTTLINGTSERPAGIANGPDGTLYLVVQKPESRWPEPRGGAIYKVGADGTRTLLAGQPLSGTIDATPVDGRGEAARFSAPWMEGVDGQGNIYVTDRGTGNVRKITAAGMVTTVAALPAELGRAPDGFRYKVDRANSSVLRINADGSETVVAGGALLPGTVLGPLPGALGAPRAVVPTGPYTFALASGGAILRLVLPH